MMEVLFTSLTETVVGVAVVVTVLLFLRYIKGRDEQMTKRDVDSREKDMEFLKTIHNHMAHEEIAFKQMADALRELSKKL